jgi:hypothetical protein
VKHTRNGVENAGWVFQDFAVPETQHPEAEAAQVGVATLVIFAERVLASISLNDEPLFQTSEVDDERRNYVLATELGGGHAVVAQHGP